MIPCRQAEGRDICKHYISPLSKLMDTGGSCSIHQERVEHPDIPLGNRSQTTTSLPSLTVIPIASTDIYFHNELKTQVPPNNSASSPFLDITSAKARQH